MTITTNARMPVVNPMIVNHVNSLKTTWTASTEQGGLISKVTKSEARSLLGSLKTNTPILPVKTYKDVKIALPDNFDARTNWVSFYVYEAVDDLIGLYSLNALQSATLEINPLVDLAGLLVPLKPFQIGTLRRKVESILTHSSVDTAFT